MLQTPLGSLEVRIDGEQIEYAHFPVPNEKCCGGLNGRYAIIVSIRPDWRAHTISCRLRDYTDSPQDGPESGENLELYSFYRDDAKLSIGMEGDTGYLVTGDRVSDYDYDTEYLPDGVQYCLLPFTRTATFLFGIAWIRPVTETNDSQTWFGADPTLRAFRALISKD